MFYDNTYYDTVWCSDQYTSGGLSASSSIQTYEDSMPISCNSVNTNSSRCLRSKEVRTSGVTEEGVTVATADVLNVPEAYDKASIGMGGRIEQKILQDNNTIDYYKEKPDAILTVYLALPDLFKSIMGKGLKQDANRKDKYIFSGKVGNIQVPLIK